MRTAQSEEEFESCFVTARKEAEKASETEQCISSILWSILVILNFKSCRFIWKYSSSRRTGLFDTEKSSEDDRRVSVRRVVRMNFVKMGETAVKGRKAAGYTNAGTVEFLLEKTVHFILWK